MLQTYPISIEKIRAFKILIIKDAAALRYLAPSSLKTLIDSEAAR
jgi:hypothetical protein